MNVRLCVMTKELARQYYKDFEMDPDLFADMTRFHLYLYDPVKCDETVDRYRQLGRVYLAVMLECDPIGEVILKNLDDERKCCTLSIHLQNDSVKNKGYGTQAEILALQYAFKEMKMNTVYADAIHKNTRSQHVLTKVGFKETHRDDTFIYYRCDQVAWAVPEALSICSVGQILQNSDASV